MHSLTSRDLWFTTPPDEADQAAWEAYADRYHERAQQIVVDPSPRASPCATWTERAARPCSPRWLAWCTD
jgi:hypothetical protein